MRKILGITMGDPAGVGPEITVKALQDPKVYESCKPLVVGDAAILERACGFVGAKCTIHPVADPSEGLYEHGTIDILDMGLLKPEDFAIGQVSAAAGDAAFRYVRKVIELAMDGKVDATVTNPLNKEAMNLAGHHFSGHTEIYAHYTGTEHYTMMLAHKDLRVVHVSTHVSLREACDRVKKDRVLEVISIADKACRDMGIAKPRIGVAGLNPHCGEGGLFGREEIDEIAPAIEAARIAGIDAQGPIPPDTIFSKAIGGWYDIVVAMYHDQGHIPLKVVGFVYDREKQSWSAVEGVNITLGLPIIRTSVDHGTAFDQAGTGNAFWAGCGEMMPGGYIQPTPEYLHKMFFRKPGLPILMVRMPDGTEKPYWNTFYQQVDYPCPDARELVAALGMQYQSACALAESLQIQLKAGKRPAELELGRWELLRSKLTDLLESRRRYLGQMDLNVASPLVWEFYSDTLHTLAGYGACIVRLDAFAYAHKAVGEHNFLNEPGTWDILARLQMLADADGVTLLPEIHASYSEKVYEKLAAKGYAVYDFFLPGLLIDALERGNADTLAGWAQEILDKHILTVNMLGCHDGIPMLDLKGLLPEERIQNLIDLIVTRGGMVKNLHGQKNVYYQVNATYYSALGESDAKMLLARAIQLFMPGKPQVWYLDLFAGKNDCEAVARAGEGGHKEINRTNLTKVQIAEALEKPVVKKQLELLRMRCNCPAFAQGAKVQIESCGPELTIEWSCSGHVARLQANLQKLTYRVEIE